MPEADFTLEPTAAALSVFGGAGGFAASWLRQSAGSSGCGSAFRSATMRMREYIAGLSLLGIMLFSGCAIKRTASAELDTATRLSAMEYRLSHIDDKLSLIQAYQTGIYVIRPGDTAAMIARFFDLAQGDLVTMNPDVRWNRLRVGERIRIRPSVEPNKRAGGDAGPARPADSESVGPGAPQL